MSEITIKLKGGCDCGAVTYTSTGVPKDVQNCYCTTCRRISGAPFVPFGGLNTSDITWKIDNPKGIKIRSSAIADRAYCETCNTTLYMMYFGTSHKTWVTLGSIHEESLKSPMVKPKAHIFVDEKVEWYEILDDVPQYAKFSDES